SMDQALAQWPEIAGTSDYQRVLEEVYRHYAAEQVLVLFLDDYAQHKRIVHARVLDFIGVDPTEDNLDLMEAQERAHTRAQQGMDGAILARLRRRKHFAKMHAMVPPLVIKRAKKFMRHPITVSSKLEVPLRQQLEKELGPAWKAFQSKHKLPLAE
ncbi:hypothetical protein OAI26_07265, partial [Sulfitobacter sp.]|nr:hypothetical protein [Sulfitobacter sp.]